MVDTVLECLIAFHQSRHLLGLLRVATGLVGCCAGPVRAFDSQDNDDDDDDGDGSKRSDNDNDDNDDDNDDNDDNSGKGNSGQGDQHPPWQGSGESDDGQQQPPPDGRASVDEGKTRGNARGIVPAKSRVTELQDWRPLVVRLVECGHLFLGADVGDTRLCHAAFDLVRGGCEVLAPYPRLLFPLLHRIWPAVVPRLHPGVTTVSLTGAVTFVTELLAVEGCGDFLRVRFREGVWPCLQGFVRRVCQVYAPSSSSSSATPRLSRDALVVVGAAGSVVPAPHQAQDGDALNGGPHEGVGATLPPSAQPAAPELLNGKERVLLLVLRCLTRLAERHRECSMLRGLSWDVCCAVVPLVVGKGVPSAVVTAAHGLYTALAEHVDADGVWLFLARVGPRKVCSPPAVCSWLPAVTLGGEASLAWTHA